MKARLEAMGDAVLGSEPVTAAFIRPTRDHLRILAYHDVVDAVSFEQQMAYLADRYVPVSAAEAAGALRGTSGLPERAVWVTFDDGSPTVVERALPIMASHGIPSTMFVCPGVVDTTTPFWWQSVAGTWSAGIRPASGRTATFDSADALVGHLKTRPDAERRAVVAGLADRFEAATGEPPLVVQITQAQVTHYLAAGGTLGNHTWDHPCLDTCSDAAAADQVVTAHTELERRFGVTPSLFAYPNGNRSEAAERTLQDLGYEVALLFDHAITEPGRHPLRTSRLRVSDRNSPARFRAIVVGAHPTWFRLRRTLAGATSV